MPSACLPAYCTPDPRPRVLACRPDGACASRGCCLSITLTAREGHAPGPCPPRLLSCSSRAAPPLHSNALPSACAHPNCFLLLPSAPAAAARTPSPNARRGARASHALPTAPHHCPPRTTAWRAQVRGRDERGHGPGHRHDGHAGRRQKGRLQPRESLSPTQHDVPIPSGTRVAAERGRRVGRSGSAASVRAGPCRRDRTALCCAVLFRHVAAGARQPLACGRQCACIEAHGHTA